MALLALSRAEDSQLDLLAALSGTDRWAGVIAKAVSFGAPSSDAALKNLQVLHCKVMEHLAKKVGICDLPNFIRRSIHWWCSSKPFVVPAQEVLAGTCIAWSVSISPAYL